MKRFIELNAENEETCTFVTKTKGNRKKRVAIDEIDFLLSADETSAEVSLFGDRKINQKKTKIDLKRDGFDDEEDETVIEVRRGIIIND